MSIWTLPSRFNDQIFDSLRQSLGYTFVAYFTNTYAGHGRVEQEMSDDRSDFYQLRHHMRGRKTRAGVSEHQRWMAWPHEANGGAKWLADTDQP